MFKARFSRRDDEGYDAAYGKGSRKITAIVRQLEDKRWDVVEGFGSDTIAADKKLGVVKEAWGAAAAAAYEGVPLEMEAPTDDTSAPPPPPLPRPGPPKLGLKAPPPPPPPKIKGPQASGGLGDDTFGEGFEERFTAPTEAKPGTPLCPTCEMPMTGWSKQRNPATDHDRFVPPCRCNKHKDANYEVDPFDFRMWKRNHETGKMDVPTVLNSMDLVFAWMSRNPEYVMTDGKLDEPWASVQRNLFETTGYAEYRPGVLGDQP